jgi:hypothetical protein
VEARVREARGGALNDPRFGHRMRGSGTYWKAIEAVFELQCRRLGLHETRAVHECEAPAAAELAVSARRAARQRPARGQLALFPEAE